MPVGASINNAWPIRIGKLHFPPSRDQPRWTNSTRRTRSEWQTTGIHPNPSTAIQNQAYEFGSQAWERHRWSLRATFPSLIETQRRCSASCDRLSRQNKRGTLSSEESTLTVAYRRRDLGWDSPPQLAYTSQPRSSMALSPGSPSSRNANGLNRFDWARVLSRLIRVISMSARKLRVDPFHVDPWRYQESCKSGHPPRSRVRSWQHDSWTCYDL